MRNLSKRLCTIVAVAGISFTGSNFTASAADIDWSKYFQNSATVSSVAAAMSLVESCSVPLSFEEKSEGGKVQLSVSCQGGEDEAATAIIEFDDLGGVLVPAKFYLAG